MEAAALLEVALRGKRGRISGDGGGAGSEADELEINEVLYLHKHRNRHLQPLEG